MLNTLFLLYYRKLIITKFEEIKRFQENKNPEYYVYDKKLGWKIKNNANHNSLPYSSDQYGNRKNLYINDQIDDLKKVALVGDSMVHGDEVRNEETWSNILAKNNLKKFKFYNLGVSGYGNDQAFLKFKEINQFHKFNYAIFCFNSGNEFRNINIQRIFLNESSNFVYLKPRFKQKNSKFELILPPYVGINNYQNNRLFNGVNKFLYENDFYHPKKPIIKIKKILKHTKIFNKQENKIAIETTLNIFEQFCIFCKQNEIMPIFLFLPKHSGRFKKDENITKLYEIISKNYDHCFYPRNLLKNNDDDNYFCKRNHYNFNGSEKIANYVSGFLNSI